MSTLATADPNELRPLLHERIDQCSLEELDAVRKLPLERAATRLFEAMAAEAEADRLAGKPDAAVVEDTIRDHRARHPYR